LEAEILSFDTNSTCRAHSVLIVIENQSIERARLARLLHELEPLNWVQRRASASDGRSHSLFLTSAGEKALARIRSLAERHEAQTAEFVEPRRQMLLMGSLKDFGRRTVSPPLAVPQTS
jgi:DNA-binding MarR family transcriptional regulator